MGREQILATLRAHEVEPRHRGLRHAALLGSVARGEERPMIGDALRRSVNRMAVRFFWMLLGGVAALHSILFVALYVTR